jgi:glucuronate isomerase
MKPGSTIASSKAAIWERTVDFERALSPTAARALLQVRFAASEHERMSELLDKARSGKLTQQEKEEMDTYELLGALLGILHSKARQALKPRAADA